MKNLLSTLTAVTVCAGVFSASANAADYCVADPDCVANGGTSVATVEDGLAAAYATPDADRLLIGPGTFTAPTTNGFRFQSAFSALEVKGAGEGKTILTGPASSNRVLMLQSTQPTSVSDVTIRMPETFLLGGAALDLSGSARRVSITADPTQNAPVVAASLRTGSTFEDGSINVPGASMSSTAALIDGPNVTIRNATVAGRRAIKGTSGAHNTLIERTTVKSDGGAGVESVAQNMRLKSSIVVSKNLNWNAALLAIGTVAGNAELHAENVTLIGDGGTGSTGAFTSLGADGVNVKVTFDNSVMRGFVRPLVASDGQTGTAVIETNHSDYNNAGNQMSSGAAIVENSRSFSANAGFRDSATGDYRLRHDSPLVDSGDNALVDQGDLDLAGNPLIADGDGAGGPERDQGAFEYQRQAPVAVIDGPAAGSPGEELTFSATKSHDADDEPLVYEWSFGDGSTASGATVKKSFTGAGTQSVTLTVTDPSGLKGSANRDVAIGATAAPADPPAPADPAAPGDTQPTQPSEQTPAPAPADTNAPALTDLRLKPARFTTKRSATSGARYGTRLTYRLDEAASVRVTIKRARQGSRTRYVRVGTLRMSGNAGLNSKRFSGRVGGRRLAAGRYQAQVVATDAAGNVAKAQAIRFTVVNP